jgi:hypothetical protein
LQTKFIGLLWWLSSPLHALRFHLYVILKYAWLNSSYNANNKMRTVLTIVDEVLAWCESLLLLCRTNFAQIFLFRKSSRRISRIVSLLIFNSSAIILRANRWSCVTISRIFPGCIHFERLKDVCILDHLEDILAHL